MFVNIKDGSHRGQAVTGIFPLIKAYNSKFVTVKTNAQEPFTVVKARIVVAAEGVGFNYCTEDGTHVDTKAMRIGMLDVVESDIPDVPKAIDYEQAFMDAETEQEAMDRIKHTFTMLERVADATQSGIIRGLVVSGPPGIGKSHGVERVLREANVVNVLAGNEPDYEIVKGTVSPIGLYKTLYQYRGQHQTIIFDDCDTILFEDVSLNLLKAALDSGEKRRLNWRSESKVLLAEDIPNAFDFEGSVMFLTNLDFERSKASRIQKHLEAIMSRCHYMDLEISNVRDRLLRIKQVVRDGMLTSYNFDKSTEEMIVNYVVDNAEYMRELSLRMVKKVADLVKMDPLKWEEYAEATCLKRDAKFKRKMIDTA